MSTSITIGEVPDEVRDELAARAALCGRSLEDYIREELMALVKRPSAAVWMARVRARKDAIQNQSTLGQNTLGQNTLGQNTLGQNTLGQNTAACPPRVSEPPSAPRASEGPVEPQRDVG